MPLPDHQPDATPTFQTWHQFDSSGEWTTIDGTHTTKETKQNSSNPDADIVLITSRWTRVRLINVHLDSLPIEPSQRPRQIAIVASLLHITGHGLVAGDFNPVLSEDATLITDNHLLDAWTEIHPQDPGFTWGVDGKQAYPPI